MRRSPAAHRAVAVLAFVVAFITLPVGTSAPAAGQQIPSPEQFFGFQMGEDRKLARWDRLVEYYELLGQQSDRLEVVNMGPSTDRKSVV